MRTVVIRETGELVLPRETLEASHINAGTTLVVIARAGQILLLDCVQVRRRVEEVGQEMQESLGKPGLFSSHFYPPFVKGGWGDFGAVTSGKSPLAPLWQRGERSRSTEN
jgi:bifunctional DNA-binding transcriptional regulator/antitoxin component of YhaV-PrlF toxin-antitoxin module